MMMICIFFPNIFSSNYCRLETTEKSLLTVSHVGISCRRNRNNYENVRSSQMKNDDTGRA
jgi:hypothetical protein